MRITLRLMGLDLFDFEIATDADSPSPEPDPRDLSGGTTGAMPMGFVARMERPHEVDVPDRDL